MREIEFRLWDIEQKIMFYNIQDGMLCKNSDNKLVLGMMKQNLNLSKE